MADRKARLSERGRTMERDRDTERVPASPEARASRTGANEAEGAHPRSRALTFEGEVTRVFEEAAHAVYEEMQHALAEQWTPQAALALQRYAEARALMVKRSGRPCPRPKEYARELVQDAYVDTWSGARAWDHTRCRLIDHLRRVIMSRTWHEAQAARRIVSLDTPRAPPCPANENDPASEEALLDRLSASSGDLSLVVLPAFARQLCRELAQATQDRDCIAVLRAWQRGFIDRDEVIDLTGLDAHAYRRARRRLLSAANDLPNELHQLVRDYLRSTP